MGKLYKRTVIAGNMVKTVVYTRPIPTADIKTRQKRKEATRAAQKFINSRNQIDKLSLLLAGNFDSPTSCFCTLTYAPSQLPNQKKDVQKEFEKFIRLLRIELGRKGHDLKYIRSIEGVSTGEYPDALDPCAIDFEKRPWNDKKRWKEEGQIEKKKTKNREKVRFHIHLIIDLTAADYETVRSLWTYGHVYIASMRVNDTETFPRLASYMTKDTRSGDTKNGERCFSCSKGLVKPVISGEWVDTDDLSIPENVQTILEDDRSESPWSYYHRVGYILNERKTEQIEETKRRGKRPL